METIQRAANNHIRAAEHLERAAHHHREAARHYQAGNHEKAGHQAHIAYGHSRHALHLADEAGRLHAQQFDGNDKA